MKNPNWHRDEAILALDLYFDKNLGSINSNNPKIVALSELLNRLPIRNNVQQTFRNPNGIVMKLANFKALDPNYQGKGLTSYSKLEKEVFEEFCSDIERLHKIANKIRQSFDNYNNSLVENN
jgi:5-methylcytosine-specific restriction protein A